jgi:dUTP pyrophosphatase
MTTAETATSPPVSPPAKRVKTAASTSEAGTLTIPVAEPQKMETAPPLLIKKLSESAKLPTRGSAFAAGYDLYASKDTIVPARGKVLVSTDISMAVPAGTCMSLSLALAPAIFLFVFILGLPGASRYSCRRIKGSADNGSV